MSKFDEEKAQEKVAIAIEMLRRWEKYNNSSYVYTAWAYLEEIGDMLGMSEPYVVEEQEDEDAAN